MYESFFGFDQRPFLTVPTLDRYFPASSIEQAYQVVMRAIQRSEGPIAIFGGAGLGKTMCCLRIAASIPRNFEVITLASAQLITRRALLQSLLYALRLPYRDDSEGDLRLSLPERLQPSEENRTDGLVLIVDEAQTLSVKLLDELRTLTNILHDGVPRLRLVLCGTLRLEETLAHPQMESLSQRLAARCYLTPLTHDESDRYVQHKIELCGRRWDEVITLDGLEAIYRAADGIPRLIDQVADQALLQGAKEKIRPINAALVGYAWSILQQLPNPWSDPMPVAQASIVADEDEFEDGVTSGVEFGFLDDIPSSGNLFVENPQNASAGASSPIGAASHEPTDFSNDKITESLLSGFANGFDEELQIPVQSLRDYQSLSGVAPGDLIQESIYDDEVRRAGPIESGDEANHFLDFGSDRSRRAVGPSGIESTSIRMARDKQVKSLGELEQQILREMRDLVADMNREPVSDYAPSQNLASERGTDDADMIVEPPQVADPVSVSVDFSEPTQAAASDIQDESFDALPDDRDIIIVEEEVAVVRDSITEPHVKGSKSGIHPYAQLYSHLRTS